MIVCRGWSGLRGGEVRVAVLAWSASRGIVIARFLKAAMTCGALAVRAWAAHHLDGLGGVREGQPGSHRGDLHDMRRDGHGWACAIPGCRASHRRKEGRPRVGRALPSL